MRSCQLLLRLLPMRLKLASLLLLLLVVFSSRTAPDACCPRAVLLPLCRLLQGISSDAVQLKQNPKGLGKESIECLVHVNPGLMITIRLQLLSMHTDVMWPHAPMGYLMMLASPCQWQACGLPHMKQG
jgi:hypothetical protein